MARLQGPLLSLKAQGKFGKVLSYQRRSGLNVARNYYYPHVAATASQMNQRALIALLNAHWAQFTDEQKAAWNVLGKKNALELSGYCQFVHSAMDDLFTHHGLSLYVSFNESSGTAVLDISGNNPDGVLSVSTGHEQSARTPSFESNFFSAFNVVDSGEAVLFYPNPIWDSAPNNACTYEAWIYPTSTTGTRSIFNFYQSTSTFDGMYLYNGTLRTRLKTSAGTVVKSAGAIAANAWQHVAFTFDGAKRRHYINGKSVYEVDEVSSLTPQPECSFKIGYNSGVPPYPFVGKIDEVRIYNRCLSTAEILRHTEILLNPNRRQETLY